VNELPSMEEFEKLVAESFQGELIPADAAGPQGENSDRPAEVAESVDQKESSQVTES